MPHTVANPIADSRDGDPKRAPDGSRNTAGAGVGCHRLYRKAAGKRWAARGVFGQDAGSGDFVATRQRLGEHCRTSPLKEKPGRSLIPPRTMS